MNRERMNRIAIDALNKAHESFGLNKVMKCGFCTSRANDEAVTGAIQQALAEREQEILDWLEQQPIATGATMVRWWKSEE